MAARLQSKTSVLGLMLNEAPDVTADRGLIKFVAQIGDTPVTCHMRRHDAAVFARRLLKQFEAMQDQQAEIVGLAAAQDDRA